MEQWKQDVATLSRRFLNASEDRYVFKGHSGKEVPAESFADYAKQLWVDIEKDNDLDLPSQRKMLSIVRCERKRTQHLQAFKIKCEAENWPECATAASFKAEVEQRLRGLVAAYVAETKGYVSCCEPGPLLGHHTPYPAPRYTRYTSAPRYTRYTSHIRIRHV